MKALSILSVLPSLNESPLTYGVTLLVCMTSIIAFYHPPLFANLVCRPEDVLHEKHRYTLFTAGLIHAGWKHLLMNIGFAFYLMDDIEYFLKSDFGPYGGICLFLLFWVGVVVIVNGLTSLKYRRHAGVSIYGMSAFTCALVVFACLYYPMEGPMKPGSKTPFICGYQLSLTFLGILIVLATLKTGRAAGPHLTGVLSAWCTHCSCIHRWYLKSSIKMNIDMVQEMLKQRDTKSKVEDHGLGYQKNLAIWFPRSTCDELLCFCSHFGHFCRNDQFYIFRVMFKCFFHDFFMCSSSALKTKTKIVRCWYIVNKLHLYNISYAYKNLFLTL